MVWDREPFEFEIHQTARHPHSRQELLRGLHEKAAGETYTKLCKEIEETAWEQVCEENEQGTDRVCFIIGRLRGKARGKIKGRVVGIASTTRVFMGISTYSLVSFQCYR